MRRRRPKAQDISASLMAAKKQRVLHRADAKDSEDENLSAPTLLALAPSRAVEAHGIHDFTVPDLQDTTEESLITAAVAEDKKHTAMSEQAFDLVKEIARQVLGQPPVVRFFGSTLYRMNTANST